MKRPKPWEKTGIYSLIVDLEQESAPLGVTASFDLGTVIKRLNREWICIGSGERLGENYTFKTEEIRCTIVRENDFKTVRSVFEKWVQKDKTLEPGKEMVLKGVLGTKDKASPIIQIKKADTFISVLIDNKVIVVRFLKENLKYIQQIDIQQEATLRGTEVYVLGLVLQTPSHEWEIQGRATLPVKE
jgi:hypothetical protein